MILNDGLIYIEPSAFSSCIALKEIVIPNSVIYVGACFSSCAKLETVILPNKITSIFQGTFQACTSLKELIIPEGVLSIDKRAFAQCRNLETIFIPASVEELGPELFNGITRQVTIKYAGSEEQWAAIEKDADWNKGASNLQIEYNTK